MPRYLMSLDCLGVPLNGDWIIKVINNMINALDWLHAHELSHMDVKPGNIFIDSANNCLLSDFGSVQKFGATTMQVTESFVPRDVPKPYRASAKFDYVMLGMTVYSLINPQNNRGTRLHRKVGCLFEGNSSRQRGGEKNRNSCLILFLIMCLLSTRK